jgi:hypothetical protein
MKLKLQMKLEIMREINEHRIAIVDSSGSWFVAST